jgi:hippurate hydrolase
MANAEFASITVYGKGGHGAAPHLTIDPVVMSSMIILELQTIISRSIKPVESAVITVGKIQGGTKNNVIPDSVHMELTLRSFTDEVRLLLRKRIEEICRGVAIAAGMPEDRLPRITFSQHYAPAVYNDPQLTERFVSIVTKILSEEHIHTVEPVTIAEDFSRFGLTKEKVPILLFWLGTVPADRIRSGDMPGLHTSRYYPDAEKSIATGVHVITGMLHELMPSD